MMTRLGEIAEQELTKSVECEEVPCGESIITKWFYRGQLIRQDCEIRIAKGLDILGQTGEV